MFNILTSPYLILGLAIFVTSLMIVSEIITPDIREN